MCTKDSSCTHFLEENVGASIKVAGSWFTVSPGRQPVDLPAEARGKELTAADIRAYGARLEQFTIKLV